MVAQKAAYLENPRDPELALHIAHLHLWRIAERSRQGEAMLPTVVDDMTLARHYFLEAKKLAPDDARIDGWIGGATLGEGAIHGDRRQLLEGYFLLRESAERYPAFNLFSFAFVLGNRPHDDPRFDEAIDAMFRNMDITNHAPMDRSNPTIADKLEVRANESDPATKRAVGNTERAPHNVEGFFLAFGDMLVKKGDTRVARIVYENARLNPDYGKWPYRWLLEDRLENLEANVDRFRAFEPTREAMMAPEVWRRGIVLNSYPCMICHQAE